MPQFLTLHADATHTREVKVVQALLIHVGIDQSEDNPMTLGVNAPIFDNDAFEFIPILELWYENTYFLRKDDRTIIICGGSEFDSEAEACTLETRTYSTIETKKENAKYGKWLSEFVPQEYENAIVHFDPDFEHFTYGDSINTSRGTQISKLKEDDYIFFVESLAPYVKEAYASKNKDLIRYYQHRNMAKYVIGYFKVQAAYVAVKLSDNPNPLLYAAPGDIDPVNGKIDEATLARIRKNAHTKRHEDHYHIVVGNPSDAMPLKRAIRLTESGSPFKPSNIGKEIYGDVGFPRGFKWIYDTSRIQALLDRCRSCL